MCLRVLLAFVRCLMMMVPGFAHPNPFQGFDCQYYHPGSLLMHPVFAPQQQCYSEYISVPKRLFVGGLPLNTSDGEFFNHFRQFFNITGAKVVRNPDGGSKGYGFLDFKTEEETDAARKNFPMQIQFGGRPMNTGPAVRKMNEVDKMLADYSVATPNGIFPASVKHIFPFPASTTEYVANAKGLPILPPSQPAAVSGPPMGIGMMGSVFSSPSNTDPVLYDNSFTAPVSSSISYDSGMSMHQEKSFDVRQMKEEVHRVASDGAIVYPDTAQTACPNHVLPCTPTETVFNYNGDTAHSNNIPSSLLTPKSAPPKETSKKKVKGSKKKEINSSTLLTPDSAVPQGMKKKSQKEPKREQKVSSSTLLTPNIATPKGSNKKADKKQSHGFSAKTKSSTLETPVSQHPVDHEKKSKSKKAKPRRKNGQLNYTRFGGGYERWLAEHATLFVLNPPYGPHSTQDDTNWGGHESFSGRPPAARRIDVAGGAVMTSRSTEHTTNYGRGKNVKESGRNDVERKKQSPTTVSHIKMSEKVEKPVSKKKVEQPSTDRHFKDVKVEKPVSGKKLEQPSTDRNSKNKTGKPSDSASNLKQMQNSLLGFLESMDQVSRPRKSSCSF